MSRTPVSARNAPQNSQGKISAALLGPQRRDDEAPQEIEPERRGHDQGRIERHVEGDQKRLRRAQVVEPDVERVARRSASGSRLSVTTWSLRNLLRAQTRKTAWGAAPGGSAGNCSRVTGKGPILVAPISSVTRRPRRLEHVHPPQRVLEDPHDLLVEEQADHRAHCRSRSPSGSAPCAGRPDAPRTTCAAPPPRPPREILGSPRSWRRIRPAGGRPRTPPGSWHRCAPGRRPGPPGPSSRGR